MVSLGIFAGAACAGNVFTPLNFEHAQISPKGDNKIAIELPHIRSNADTAIINHIETTGSKNLQTAITELDSAQVEVRNELLNYKTKFSEVDAKYVTIKTERNNLSKQIRACERKIRQLDNAKEKIRKNMASQ